MAYKESLRFDSTQDMSVFVNKEQTQICDYQQQQLVSVLSASGSLAIDAVGWQQYLSSFFAAIKSAYSNAIELYKTEVGERTMAKRRINTAIRKKVAHKDEA